MPEGQDADASCIQRNSPGLPTLIVIRGNSGSGKSSVAREVRRRYGRGCALVEQDYLRRIVLREHDTPDGVAPRLIGSVAETALAGGYHVVVEGILKSHRYGDTLRRLIAAHAGHAYYLDVSFAESVRRHGMRPQAANFTPAEMREWYVPHDVLGVPGERVVPESSTLAETVETILRTSSLDTTPAAAPCPTSCDHCG